MNNLREPLARLTRNPARVRRGLFAAMAAAAFAVAAIAAVEARETPLEEIASSTPVELIEWSYMLAPSMFIFWRILRRATLAKETMALIGAAVLCWLMMAPVGRQPLAREHMVIALVAAAAMGLITDLAVAAAERWDRAFAIPYVAIAAETWVGLFLWIMWRYPERVSMVKFLWALDAMVAATVVASVYFFLSGGRK